MTIRVLLLVGALGLAAPAALLVRPPFNLALSGAALALSVLVLASDRRRSAPEQTRPGRRSRRRRRAELERQLAEAFARVEQQAEAIAELTNLLRTLGERFDRRAAAVDVRLAALEADRADELERRRRRAAQSARLRMANQHLEHETRELQRVMASEQP